MNPPPGDADRERPRSGLPGRLLALAGHHRHAIKDVVVSMVPQGVRLAVSVVSAILLARGLGPKGMGQYALVASAFTLVFQLCDLGTGQTAIRFGSRAVALGQTALQLAVLRWAFRLRLAALLVLSGGGYLVAPVVTEQFWHTPALTPLVRIGLLIGACMALAAVPTVYFQSLRRFWVNAVVGAGQGLVMLLGVLLLAVTHRWAVSSVVTVMLVSTAVGALAFMVLVPRAALFVRTDVWPLSRLLSADLWRAPDQGTAAASADGASPTRFALYMVLSSIIAALIARCDVWMLGHYLDDATIGVYQIAAGLTLPLTTLGVGINTALLPRVSAVVGAAGTRRLLGGSLQLAVVMFVGLVIYSLCAPLLIPFVFGAAYAPGVLLAQLLCLRYCIGIPCGIVSTIGYNYGLLRHYWLVNLLQLCVTVGGTLLLVPRVGAAGAAIALIACDAVGLTVFALLVLGRSGARGGGGGGAREPQSHVAA